MDVFWTLAGWGLLILLGGIGLIAVVSAVILGIIYFRSVRNGGL